jgi:hypothetical protein
VEFAVEFLMEGKLTVYFEDPFWVGVFEREDETGYRVCRVVFGPEPTDAELLAYIQEEFADLDFGEPLEGQVEIVKKKNFKRVQREVRREMEEGVGTKAQRAMQAALELNKREREVMSRERREEEQELKFRLRQEKRKEKHRGH